MTVLVDHHHPLVRLAHLVQRGGERRRQPDVQEVDAVDQPSDLRARAHDHGVGEPERARRALGQLVPPGGRQHDRPALVDGGTHGRAVTGTDRLVWPQQRAVEVDRQRAHRHRHTLGYGDGPAMPTMTPKDYFEAGQDLLGEGGIQTVTIANVCERLGVTKGSFYHHFRNVEDFHDRLLDDWFTEHVARRKAISDAITDPRERLDALRRLGVERRHDAEAAIRAWARSSARAAEVQRRIDNTRRAYMVDTCCALGIDRRRAEVFADLAIVALAGSQNLCGPVDRAMVGRIIDEITDQVLAAVPASTSPSGQSAARPSTT